MRQALVLVVLFVPSLVWGQWAPASPNAVSRWEVGIFAGYSFGGEVGGVLPEDTSQTYKISLENGAAFGLELGIPVGADSHVQLWVSRQTTDMEGSQQAPDGGSILGDMKVTHMQVMWVRSWRSPRGPSYYSGIGAGLTQLEPDLAGVSGESNLSLGIAFGGKYFMGRNTALRLDARYIVADTDDEVLHESGDVMFRYRDQFSQAQVSLGVLFLW